jgi:hypothetical protein
MNTSILIEKDGNIKIANIKDLDKLYNVCNYRNNNNFELLHTWKNTNVNYELYGKRKNKGGIKNIYQLPYPIDKEIYYGTLCLIKKNNNIVVNISMEDFISIINQFKNEKEENNKAENNNEENNNEEHNNEENNHLIKNDMLTDVNKNNNKNDEDIMKTLLLNREKELTYEEYEEE